MSLKHYGIYIAYPPTVDLRHEGLGRYLAAFLKGAAAKKGVCFTIVCPSWSRESLSDLLEAEGVPVNSCNVVSPHGLPLILRLHKEWIKFSRREKKPSLTKRISDRLHALSIELISSTVHRLVKAYSIAGLVRALWPLGTVIALAMISSPLWITLSLLFLMAVAGKKIFQKIMLALRIPFLRISAMTRAPKDDDFVRQMYRGMELAEAHRMQTLISTMVDVRAWYCPTAFWPAFNQIQAPRLMCVPDVVLTDFPVGFAAVGGDRFMESFEIVEKAIAGAQFFVTYSLDVKWNTLVDRYGVQGGQVSVIHHAPNDLSQWLSIRGFADETGAKRSYSKWLLSTALLRAHTDSYATGFLNTDVKFLFYASQMRPNKNVLNLLRAYKHLLRDRLIGHKLIMTGNYLGLPEIKNFIVENNLENEVLFLSGLKIEQLAACYHLADLAVNPSLSEGGCPFTFAEALSVGTPVVMARIPVTEEVLVDPELQEMSFFDPYDWMNMADKIEWALRHRDELLMVQRRTYADLSRRTWSDVVDEHLVVLDRIAK